MLVIKNIVLLGSTLLFACSTYATSAPDNRKDFNQLRNMIENIKSELGEKIAIVEKKTENNTSQQNNENDNKKIRTLEKQFETLNNNVNKLKQNGVSIDPKDIAKVQELKQKAEHSLPTAKQALNTANESKEMTTKVANVVNETKNAVSKIEASINELQNKGIPLRNEDIARLDEGLGKVNEVNGQLEKMEEKIKELEAKFEQTKLAQQDKTHDAQANNTPSLITQSDKQKILTLSKAGAVDSVNQLLNSPVLSQSDKAVVRDVAVLGQKVASGAIFAEKAEELINDNQKLEKTISSNTPDTIENLKDKTMVPTQTSVEKAKVTDDLLLNDTSSLDSSLIIDTQPLADGDLLSDAEQPLIRNVENDLLQDTSANKSEDTEALVISKDLLSQNDKSQEPLPEISSKNDLLTDAPEELIGNDLLETTPNTSSNNEDLLNGLLEETNPSDDLLTETQLTDGNLTTSVSNEDLLQNGVSSNNLTETDLLQSSIPSNEGNVINDLLQENTPSITNNLPDVLDNSNNPTDTLRVIDSQGNIKHVAINDLKNKVLSIANE